MNANKLAICALIAFILAMFAVAGVYLVIASGLQQ